MRSSSRSGMYDERAQWMVISGIVIALAVISLSVLLSEVSTSGIRISYSPSRLPYYEAKSIVVELTRAYKNGDVNKTNEKEVCENVSKLFALNGYSVQVSYEPENFETLSSNLVVYVNTTHVKFSTKNFNMVVVKNVTTTTYK